MTKPVVYIIIYSLYHHVYKLSLSVKEGLEKQGVEVQLFQVPETLSEDILVKMQAREKLDLPFITVDKLSEPDGIMFGFPTRFGTIPAQMKALLDASGSLWAKGALAGKFVGTFFSTASQHGGQETTALTTITYFAHHGMLYVPFGYANPAMNRLDEVVGGSAYGCGTVSDGDGSRQPTETELNVAVNQGVNFANVVTTFVKGKDSLNSTIQNKSTEPTGINSTTGDVGTANSTSDATNTAGALNTTGTTGTTDAVNTTGAVNTAGTTDAVNASTGPSATGTTAGAGAAGAVGAVGAAGAAALAASRAGKTTDSATGAATGAATGTTTGVTNATGAATGTATNPTTASTLTSNTTNPTTAKNATDPTPAGTITNNASNNTTAITAADPTANTTTGATTGGKTGTPATAPIKEANPVSSTAPATSTEPNTTANVNPVKESRVDNTDKTKKKKKWFCCM